MSVEDHRYNLELWIERFVEDFDLASPKVGVVRGYLGMGKTLTSWQNVVENRWRAIYIAPRHDVIEQFEFPTSKLLNFPHTFVHLKGKGQPGVCKNPIVNNMKKEMQDMNISLSSICDCCDYISE